MGVQEEILRIRQEFVGDDQMARAKKAYEGQEEAIRKLTKAFNDGRISEATYIARTQPHAEQLLKLRKQMDDLNRSAGRGSGGLATTLTQLSYAADDAQYGMRGLSNNIAPLLSQFGVWGSVVAIGAVGIYQATQHWRSLSATFRNDLIEQKADQVKTLTERMEELNKETKLTAKEMQEMDNLRIEIEGRQAAKKDEATPTERQAGVKSAYQEALSKDKGYQGLENAAHESLFHEYSKNPYSHIMDASQEGLFKDDDGKEMKVDRRMLLTNKAYADKMMAKYTTEVLPVLKADLLKRIGTDGDEQAVQELHRGLKATGRYDIDEDGNVTDINGKKSKPLSALMRNSPEVRKRRENKESDEAAVAALKGEQEEEFKRHVAGLAADLHNRVGQMIANGKQGKALEDAVAEVLKQAYPDKQFGGRQGPGAFVGAIIEKVKKDLNDELNKTVAGNNIRREDAKAMIGRNVNAAASKIPNEINDKNREADLQGADEREKAKKERDAALESGVSEGLQGQIMLGLFSNRQMALPGNKSTASQKAKQAADLARFKDRIIQEAYEDLIKKFTADGMTQGEAASKAGDLSRQAPQFFMERYNAWLTSQTLPGGGGVADAQNPTAQERARGVPIQRRGNGFNSVGVEAVQDNQMEQAQLTAQSIQNQTEIVNRQIAIEQQLKAAQQANRVLHQRQRTAQLWGR